MKKVNHNSSALFGIDTQRGLMLVALLIFLAISAYTTLKTSEVWSTVIAREREQELLFVGDQYRRAIESYYNSSPPTEPKKLPGNKEDLLRDIRSGVTKRHLRKLYLDPINDSDFELLKSGGGISGIASFSADKKPVKQSFNPPYENFTKAQSYRGWKFLFVPPKQVSTTVQKSASITVPQSIQPPK
jgi:type II secretory pathway pseudopilin PulG